MATKTNAPVLIVSLSAVGDDAPALLAAHKVALEQFLGGAAASATVELTNTGTVTAVEPSPDYPQAAGYRSTRQYTIALES